VRELQVPEDLIPYSSFGAPINLYAVKNSRPAFVLLITGAGTVTVRMSGSGSSTRTIPVTDGQELYGKFLSIESVSGVTGIVAGWN
jgi:hypothetical protein